MVWHECDNKPYGAKGYPTHVRTQKKCFYHKFSFRTDPPGLIVMT